MELYRDLLLEKPMLLVINKMDVSGAWKKFEEIESRLREMHSKRFHYLPCVPREKMIETKWIVKVA